MITDKDKQRYIEDISRLVACDHAYAKHHLREDIFNNPPKKAQGADKEVKGGPLDIKTPHDLTARAAEIMQRPDNQIVVTDKHACIYNRQDNVFMVLCFTGDGCRSTMYRLESGERRMQNAVDEARRANKHFNGYFPSASITDDDVMNKIIKGLRQNKSLDGLAAAADRAEGRAWKEHRAAQPAEKPSPRMEHFDERAEGLSSLVAYREMRGNEATPIRTWRYDG